MNQIETCPDCGCAFIGSCRCKVPLPAAFWRWRCPCGQGGAHDSPTESDAAASRHELATGHSGISMHTAATAGAWTGQAKLAGMV